MATKPGPILALAGLAALFALGKSGGKKGFVPDPDDLEPGDEYPETGKPEKGTHSTGGVKVPKGTGVGGSDWGLSKQPSPDTLWIAPDCRGFYEGPDWYEETFIPKMEEHFDTLNAAIEADYRDALESAGETLAPGEALGGTIKVPAINLYAQMAEMVDIETGEVIDDAIKDKPNSCIATAPWFNLPSEFNNFSVAADVANFRSALNEWAKEFPVLFGLFASIETRMLQDVRLRRQYLRVWDIYEVG